MKYEYTTYEAKDIADYRLGDVVLVNLNRGKSRPCLVLRVIPKDANYAKLVVCGLTRQSYDGRNFATGHHTGSYLMPCIELLHIYPNFHPRKGVPLGEQYVAPAWVWLNQLFEV